MTHNRRRHDNPTPTRPEVSPRSEGTAGKKPTPSEKTDKKKEKGKK